MKTKSNVGARCPYPREGNGFVDPMKTQILSLTPRFSEVWCPLRNLNGFNRLVDCRSLLSKKLLFQSISKAFKEKNFEKQYGFLNLPKGF
jgi:hypothetical protein